MKTAPRETANAALAQVLSELHREAWAWALACCDRQRADAQDVLQTTYLKILDGRARFDGRSSPLTWLFAVIRRTAADMRRRRWLRGLLVEPDASAPATDPPAEAPLEAAEDRRAIVAALAALPRRQREVLTLVFYCELTVAQTAEVLGTSTGSVSQHYARGKQALRRKLQGTGS